MGKKLKPEQLIKGIYLSAKSLQQEFTERQTELVIELLSCKKPQKVFITFRRRKDVQEAEFSEEQLTMMGTALQQNYAMIATLLPEFETEGFNSTIIESIKETVKSKGKYTREELMKKYNN